jgi:hypothetical protein
MGKGAMTDREDMALRIEQAIEREANQRRPRQTRVDRHRSIEGTG